jgi:Kef-type K+ transport system membrane component KefB
MAATSAILTDLFIIFLAARVAGEIFVRLRQPAVVGELLAGILIGPLAFGFVGTPDSDLIALFHDDSAAAEEALTLVYEVLAEMGVIILLFFVGLETHLRDLLGVGRRALLVGIGGIIVPFGAGYALMRLRGTDNIESLFVATALVATSVGITARVLRDLGVLERTEARIILGAAVVDDILAMITLAVVSSVSGGGDLDPLNIGLIAVQALAFTGFVALVGSRAVRNYHAHLDTPRIEHSPLVVSLLLMLGLAAASASIGLAAIIGAFLAGMVLAEAREHYELERAVVPIYEFLAPFFFVFTGMQVDPGFFTDGDVVLLAAGVTIVAVAGKLIGASVGTRGLPRRQALAVGIGMVPRGEVGLIVASLGFSLGVIGDEIFAVVVIMAVVTTLLVPPILVALYRSERQQTSPMSP